VNKFAMRFEPEDGTIYNAPPRTLPTSSNQWSNTDGDLREAISMIVKAYRSGGALMAENFYMRLIQNATPHEARIFVNSIRSADAR